MFHFASVFTASIHQRFCTVLFHFSFQYIVKVGLQVVKCQSLFVTLVVLESTVPVQLAVMMNSLNSRRLKSWQILRALLPPTGMVLIIALLPNLCITVSHTKVEDNKPEQGVIINCYGNVITQVKFISPVYCYFH